MTPTVLTGLHRVGRGDVVLPPCSRLALLSNRAAVTPDGYWSGEVLSQVGRPPSLLLSPEHGLDLSAAAGVHIGHSRLDQIPVLSLYGADLEPVKAALSEIDLLVIDLPDVGCRYYTYPWTVRECLRLCANKDISVILLDRPNPLGGVEVEGNLPDTDRDSPVCASYVPVRHGLTLGELSRWQVQTLQLDVNLTVVPMEGWERHMPWIDTGLPWTSPSPALRSSMAAAAYPGTCLVEGTNLSEGRGTHAPFLQIGAPFLDTEALLDQVHDAAVNSGITLFPTNFIPTASKWKGFECRGIGIEIHGDDVHRPVQFGLSLIEAAARQEGFAYLPFFDTLSGTSNWRVALQAGGTAEEVATDWEKDEGQFIEERQSVLLYPHVLD